MSTLNPGDDHLHYQDGSHRWIASSPEHDRGHRQTVRAHIAEHQRRYGNEPVRRSRRDTAGPFPRERT